MTAVLKAITLSLTLTFSYFQVQKNQEQAAQTPVENLDSSHFCAADHLHEKLLNDFPERKVIQDNFEQKLYDHLNSNQAKSTPPPYTLPVVVHIVHQNGPENITDAQVIQGIQDLNDAFENVGYYDQDTGVNTQLSFCLAQQDPDGNPTTGITRDVSPFTETIIESQDIDLKDVNRWDPLTYINIWVIDEIISASAGAGVIGYAYFPTSHGMPEDGLVVEAGYFGNTQSNSAVIVHEMGHYLGLYHTFQGGCTNNDCLADGDRVCDTPPDQTTVAAPCDFPQNSCDTDVNAADPNNPFTTDQDDMIINYMDYGDLMCYSAFTQGQTDRMVFSIEDIRFTLLGSVGCNDPCTVDITAGFDASATIVNIGETIDFTNTSTDANAYSWKIDGVEFATTTDASFTFNELGFFELTLMSMNDDPNCMDSLTITIEITCPVDASFLQDAYLLDVNETVNLTNTSINATSYEWYVDGILQSTATDFSTAFPTGGTYSIYLVAIGPLCSDTTSLTNFVQVGDCDVTVAYLPSEPTTCDDIQFSANTDCDYESWYWSFCEADLLSVPNIQPNQPVGSSPTHCDFVDDVANGTGYHLFVTRYNQGVNRVVRLDYGNDLNNVPTQTTLNTPGIPTDADHIKNEGIDIVFENGEYYGFFTVWNDVYRFNFGADILNDSPEVTLIGGGYENDFSWAHSLDMYKIGANWWGILTARSGDLVVLYFGNNVEGDVLEFYTYDGGNNNAAFTGATYILEDDTHYILACDFQNGLIRFNFGNSLSNVPTTENLGFFGTGNQWSITAYKECGDSYAVAVFKENNDDHKLLRFSPSIASAPVEIVDVNGLGRTSGVSSFHRVNDELLYFVVRSTDGEVAKLSYQDCQNSVPLSSNLQTPPPVFYGEAGTYNVRLIVDEGLPWQQVICTQVMVDSCDQENCFNGRDDDGDGLIDCYDPDCCESEFCDGFYYADCDVDCTIDPTPGIFDLEVEWSTLGGTANWCAYNTPFTADVDNDGIPEVFGKPCTGGNQSSGIALPNIMIVDGATGLVETVITSPAFTYANDGPSAADLDGNGFVEIFYQASDIFQNQTYSGTIINGDVRRRVVCYEFDGTDYQEKWMSNVIVGYNPVEDGNTISSADFNGDGISEIYIGNQILNGATGELIVQAGANMSRGLIPTAGFLNHAVSYTIAADVLPDDFCDDCQGLELVAGNVVYSVNINTANPAQSSINVEVEAAQSDGRTSIADFDNDGDVDALVTSDDPNNSTFVYVWDLQTTALVVNIFEIPGTFSSDICQANIADFDGDGEVETGVVTASNYHVLKRNGNNFSILWALTTNDGSGQTGSTVFDFNNDGQYEVVYRDQDNIRILNGATGVDLFSEPCQSGTRVEYPVVVDVDADGETELLCSCANELRAYGSAGTPWVPTRPVWNQRNYFNVNINDDLTVPSSQQPHHIVGDSIILNNFLTQYADPDFPVADAIVSVDSFGCGVDSFLVKISICNEGDSRLTGETPLTFYDDNPTNTAANSLLTKEIGENIDPDSCLIRYCYVPAQYDLPIFVVINDDASLAAPYDLANDFPVTSVAECDYENNMDNFLVEGPPPPRLDLGPDTLICDNGVLELNAGSGFVSYEWQDGMMDSLYTIWQEGRYWVTVIDSCGNLQSDTIEVNFDIPTVAFTEPQAATICPGQSVTFCVQGEFFDNYEWQDASNLDCSDCQCVTATPDSPTSYIVIAWTDAGCYSVDTVTVSFANIQTANDLAVCTGETVMIHGEEISQTGTYAETFTIAAGCDSTSSITLTNFPQTTSTTTTTDPCAGGTDGAIVLTPNGIPPFNYQWDIAGVGNTNTVNNLMAGTYTVMITDGNNCLTMETILLVETNDADVATEATPPTCPGDTNGQIEILNPDATWTFSLDNVTFQDSPIFENLPAGDYTVFINDDPCFYEESLIVPAATILEVEIVATPGLSGSQGDTIQLTVTPLVTGATYEWLPEDGLSCTTCPNPTAVLMEDITYEVEVTDTSGCITRSDISLEVVRNCNQDDIQIPNAFTPNGDGANDVFQVVSLNSDATVSSMRIYNRWGEKVFEASGANVSWDGMLDGEPASADVYIYVIVLECDSEEKMRTGDLSVLR